MIKLKDLLQHPQIHLISPDVIETAKKFELLLPEAIPYDSANLYLSHKAIEFEWNGNVHLNAVDVDEEVTFEWSRSPVDIISATVTGNGIYYMAHIGDFRPTGHFVLGEGLPKTLLPQHFLDVLQLYQQGKP